MSAFQQGVARSDQKSELNRIQDILRDQKGEGGN